MFANSGAPVSTAYPPDTPGLTVMGNKLIFPARFTGWAGSRNRGTRITPPIATKVGAFVHQNAGENIAQAVQRFNTAVSPQTLQVVRMYDSGGGPGNINTGLGQCSGAGLTPTFAVSTVRTLAQTTGGGDDAAYATMFAALNALPNGPHHYTFFQEMDAVGSDSGYAMSPTHHAACLAHILGIKGSSYPNVKVSAVFTGTSFTTRLAAFKAAYQAAGIYGTVDGLGVDEYVPLSSAGETLSTRVASSLAAVQAEGKSFEIWETGQEGYGSGLTDAQMEAFITSIEGVAAEALFVSWFNSQYNGDLDITAHSAWASAFQAVLAAL
jgi:hypothetical protein